MRPLLNADVPAAPCSWVNPGRCHGLGVLLAQLLESHRPGRVVLDNQDHTPQPTPSKSARVAACPDVRARQRLPRLLMGVTADMVSCRGVPS
jgi:hypothetical protein